MSNELKTAAPIEDFDWDAFAQGETYNKEQKKELTEIYDQTLSEISDKEVVTGTVTAMDAREVLINIGFKSHGIISANEFRYNPELKVGDEVEVYIENQEDRDGQLILSHKKARASRAWDRVNAALENNEVITGYIKCRTKGGMIVDVFGIEAFLPGSQIDVRPIRDYDFFVGKTMEFKVVKINPEYKNVVVSHKALIQEELEQQKKEIISNLEKGQVLEGTVKNITSYGVFIDLGGVDGLVHITDLSWGRVQHPEEVVSLDDKINVVILDYDEERKRIALGIKQLTPHPWDALDAELKIGDIVKGKVVVMADYGAFVEIEQGVEGLVHVSEMSWTQHLRSAQDFLKVGDEIEAEVLTLDREERKMSLGMKQLKPDPWEDIETKYPVGSKHDSIVRNFTNFGIFVEIEEGVEGLVHISDLSWTKKIKHPSEITELGANLEIQVLEVDKDNRRLSLGHKQLDENPWEVFETVFTVGSVHEGTVVELLDKGAVISLPYGVEAFATSRFLVKEDGSQAQLEEKLDFQIVEFNKDSKRILVSHSRTYEADQAKERKAKESKPSSKRAPRRQAAVPSAPVEKSTLGDIEELADLKEKLTSKKISEANAAVDKKEAKKEAEQEEAPVEKVEDAEDAKKVTAAAEEKAEDAEEVEATAEEKTEKKETTVEEKAKDTDDSKKTTATAEEKVEKKAEDKTESSEESKEADSKEETKSEE